MIWPDVEEGKTYRVTSAEHEGREGICMDTNESAFGHKWAKLKFADGSNGWIRTKMLEEVQ